LAEAIHNAVLHANPISLIIIAVAALIALFVILWNKCDTFRKIVIDVAQGVIRYVAFMIGAWGELITVILKVITGPMQLFLEVLSHLPKIGKYAKEGLNFIKTGIKDIGDFADSTSKKLNKTADSLDKLKNKKLTAPSLSGSSSGSVTSDPNAPYSLDNYSGSSGGSGGGKAGVTQNIVVYASDTNDIAKKMAQAARTGIPIGTF